ncbi:MAG: hypothetical protein OEU90_13885, partial [Gammaproteobacteria bacterium]|nr:hypothetical protein [Gammaproteobacteria bacterium]
MKIAQSTPFLALLLGLLVAVNSPAQEAEDGAATTPPDLNSLQTNWWAYFEGSRAEIQPRVDTYLDDVGVQIANLAPQNQETAQSVLNTVRGNFTALLALLDDTELTLQELPAAAASYSIEELLKLAAIARDARSGAAEEQLEVDREKRILDGTGRRRDAAFKAYVDAAVGDERWLAGLRLLQARSAQAIS